MYNRSRAWSFHPAASCKSRSARGPALPLTLHELTIISQLVLVEDARLPLVGDVRHPDASDRESSPVSASAEVFPKRLVQLLWE